MMWRPARWIAVPAILGAVACNPADPPAESVRIPVDAVESTPDSLRDQVVALIEQYYADFSARDWDRYRDHFWPGAALTTIWKPAGEPEPRFVAATVEEFVRQAPNGPGSREIFEERLDSAEVRGSGNIALVWARYSARFGDPGDVREWKGIDAFSLLRHNGRWRIAALAYVSDEEGPG